MFNQNDEVIVYTYGRYKMGRVERVTKTQVTVEGKKYRLSDGGELGGNGHSSRIMEVTKTNLAIMRGDAEERERKILIGRISDAKWRGLPKEKLEAILKIMESESE